MPLSPNRSMEVMLLLATPRWVPRVARPKRMMFSAQIDVVVLLYATM